MDSSSSVFSQTLQEITTTKLEELAKKRSSFEKQKTKAIQNADKQDDAISMLTALADGTRLCFSVRIREGKIVRGSSGNPRLENDLRNLNRFIDQARFDPSVSDSITEQWRQTLLKHLELQSLKYQYADLYGKLTMEWLTSSIPKVEEGGDAMDTSEEFEKVSNRAKLEARQNWERDVFQEAQVDKDAIKQFLDGLFASKEGQKALFQIRKDVGKIENSLSGGDQFDIYSLGWVINGLLASDLLTEEKRQALRDFQSNNVILTELADVLNMRMAALNSWSWGDEVEVEVRRQVNGNFNIYMHEDLLQAIFLQYIGVQWSVKVKKALMTFQKNAEVWTRSSQKPSPLELQRRTWYLGCPADNTNVQQIRNLTYRGGYFLSQLQDNVHEGHDTEEGDEEANFDEFAAARRQQQQMAVQAPRAPMMQQVQSSYGGRAIQTARKGGGAKRHRRIAPDEVDEDDDEDSNQDDDEAGQNLQAYKPKNPMDAKQRLLHLLSTEILVKTRLQGEISCFRSQFQSWNPLLPHGTIEAVLQFFGVSQKWSNFFKTFLRAPLKFMGELEEPRQRKRGTPGAHALSEFFGEVVLFCLEYAINQQTEGEVLWRMHDDFWFWSSSHEACVKAWSVIEQFNEVMSVSLDDAKSAAVRMQSKRGSISPAKLHRTLPEGNIRWGMIYLDDKTGRFTIDQEMVDKHIEELRRQLQDKERSIFSWVQAYSTYASVFFTSNFGKPANCFGRDHLDVMLTMHERIQTSLFNGSENGDVNSVVDWLKKQIEQRFGVTNIPDGYVFLPTSLGGLDVKSPFIGLLQLRDSVTEDPNVLFNKFVQSEKDNYELRRKQYLEKKKWEYPSKQGEYRPKDPTQFMSFEEYSKFREDVNHGYTNQLSDVYKTLLQRPEEEPVENEGDVQISEALNRIRQSHGQEQTMTSWYGMTPYWKWVAMLYGPEMIQKFGGFEIVDAGYLPMGMVSLFKSGRVSWQE